MNEVPIRNIALRTLTMIVDFTLHNCNDHTWTDLSNDEPNKNPRITGNIHAFRKKWPKSASFKTIFFNKMCSNNLSFKKSCSVDSLSTRQSNDENREKNQKKTFTGATVF